MDDQAVVAVLGSGAGAASAWLCLRRAKLSRSHRRAGDAMSWLVATGALGAVAVSFAVAPGLWIDAYGGALEVMNGG